MTHVEYKRVSRSKPFPDGLLSYETMLVCYPINKDDLDLVRSSRWIPAYEIKRVADKIVRLGVGGIWPLE